jgi:hypothetical protein
MCLSLVSQAQLGELCSWYIQKMNSTKLGDKESIFYLQTVVC